LDDVVLNGNGENSKRFNQLRGGRLEKALAKADS